MRKKSSVAQLSNTGRPFDIYRDRLFETVCHGMSSRDPETKFYDPKLIVNFRSDYICQPNIKRDATEDEIHSSGISEFLAEKGYKKRSLRRSSNKFHEVVNAVLKKVINKVRFENDALKMFLFQANKRIPKPNEKPPTLSVDSSQFRKLLLIVNSMKLYHSENIRIDEFSEQVNKYLVKNLMDIKENRAKFRNVCKSSAIINLKQNTFLLFNEYETKKLALEKSWSIHENVCTGRTYWAAKFLTNVIKDQEALQKSTKFAWLLIKTIRYLSGQENLLVRPMAQNDKRKLRNWKEIVGKFVAFKENMNHPPLEEFYDKFRKLFALDIRRREMDIELTGLMPYIEIFRLRRDDYKRSEKEVEKIRKMLNIVKKEKENMK